MNEWLQKMLTKLKELWAKWSIVQKVIIFGIIAAVIVAIFATAKLSSAPATVRLFSSPVTDPQSLSQILDRIDQENVKVFTTTEGYISVEDERTARRMREILISENLVPSSIDVWAGYYDRSWSTTDAEQNQKLKNTIQRHLKQHIEAIDDIQSADVTLVIPEKELFFDSQNPVTASVIIRPKNNSSDILTNRNRILGLQRLILSAVEGLTAENLIIADVNGEQINDFEGMAESDRVDIIAKQQKLRREQETKIRASILQSLQRTFTEDRCRDMNVAVEMDMSEKKSDSTTYSPIEIKKDNPDTPFDDSEYRDTLPLSQQTITKEWQGTGFNPEGPAGVEGQNPPVYSDMSNVIGKSTETGVTQNNVINTKQTSEVTAPKIDKISVSVNLDGIWEYEYEPGTRNYVIENGSIKRKYIPISAEDLIKAENLIKGAIGYDRNRGDTVDVTNLAYDRTEDFKKEDDAYFAEIQRKRTILIILAAVAIVLIGFILFRIISRELERRRRLREEELLRRQQMEHDRILYDAEQASMVATLSVEERERAELQEHAISMAREHPEDVALLIRTWLMEE